MFNGSAYSTSAQGQLLLLPYCTTSVAANASCPTANKVSINPNTGAQLPLIRAETFDPATYSGTPFSGIVSSTSYFLRRLRCSWDRASVSPMTCLATVRRLCAAASVFSMGARLGLTRWALRVQVSGRSQRRHTSWRHWCSTRRSPAWPGLNWYLHRKRRWVDLWLTSRPQLMTGASAFQQDLGKGFSCT